MWLVALACIAGGGCMWIAGTVKHNTTLQILGNVTVGYLPVMFCAIGACKLMKKKEHYEMIV